MKILFLSRYQNRFQRGAENFVLELSKRLSRNFKVDIFSGHDSDDTSKVIKGAYDIVIPINGRLQSLKSSLGRMSGKYKLLISGHSGIGRDDIWNIAVCKPDVFVALTSVMADWAKSWAWGSRVEKIPNGIDLTKFTPKGEKIKIDLPRPVILSVGALSWYKHHEKLIKAVEVLEEGSVLIVGNGEEKANLEKLGRNLGTRFKIADFEYKDMPKLYRSCDIFSLPSWDREAFGLVYLEAMASELGIVAPDDLSRREIVGDGGIFTDVDNPVIYAQALKQGLNNNWSKRARVQAEKFSWEKVANEYQQLMMDILKSNKE